MCGENRKHGSEGGVGCPKTGTTLPTQLFRAAADAQRIADYLLAFHPTYAKTLDDARDDTDDKAVPAVDAAEAEAA